MQSSIEIKIVSYYFDTSKIKNFLKQFDYNIDIIHLQQLRLPDKSDCMDMSAYYSILRQNQEKHVILVNDTLFKKYFWKTTLRSLTRLVESYSNIDDIPVLIGDVHKTADFYSGYHSAGKHVSTYAFYANKPAQDIFKNIYETYQDNSLYELLTDPYLQVLNIRNFEEIDSNYAWKGVNQMSNDTHLRKFKAIVIELNFSKFVFSEGIIIDLKDTFKNRLLYKLRGILNK